MLITVYVSTIIIWILLVFIAGLVFGVNLAKPKYGGKP